MRPGVNLSNMTNCPVLPIKLLPPTCTHSCENRTKTIMYYDDFLGSIRQFGDGGFHLFGGFHLLSLVISKRIQSLAREKPAVCKFEVCRWLSELVCARQSSQAGEWISASKQAHPMLTFLSKLSRSALIGLPLLSTTLHIWLWVVKGFKDVLSTLINFLPSLHWSGSSAYLSWHLLTVSNERSRKWQKHKESLWSNPLLLPCLRHRMLWLNRLSVTPLFRQHPHVCADSTLLSKTLQNKNLLFFVLTWYL